jgi:curli production assembly/transport component CsgG
MTKLLISIIPIFLLGCAVVPTSENYSDSPVILFSGTGDVQPPNNKPVVVAVYSFKDHTGQRKNSAGGSTLSSAVTQGAESYLIRSLMTAGGGKWFTVVERVGLENLLRERQMIQQSRISAGESGINSLTLAGVIIEGGIIDYSSNVSTGGIGVRVFGIGPSTQYNVDSVVVSLRMVSVITGEILATVTVERQLLSVGTSGTVFRFFNTGTRAFELDAGATKNTSTSYAIRSAIDKAVIELINEGDRLKLWSKTK